MSSLAARERTPLLEESWEHVSRSLPGPGVSPIISETDEAITVRRPLRFYSINTAGEDVQQRDHGHRTRAAINRYRYYSRLDPQSNSSLLMPSHVVPPEYFLVIPIKVERGTQSSIITIFSIWNTMMGTSILSMPWALERAGFGCGLAIMVVMAALTLYTAYRVLDSPRHVDGGVVEFSDICYHYFGRWGRQFSILFSLLALLGATIVYWVLMTNFLYNSVSYIYDQVTGAFNHSLPLSNITSGDVLCPNQTVASYANHDQYMLYANFGVESSVKIFNEWWTPHLTVPLFLVLILGPLINFESPTFFTKFNALGTLSVVYIISFIIIKACKWGINMDFDHPGSAFFIPEFQWTFPALTGTLSLAYFIHNCVISIMKNQKHPENNGRDLSIAYILVAFTYIIVGTTFYMTFPLSKDCIEDNLLNNFVSSDLLSFVARIFLFFQMVTVFPLLAYLLRVQVMNTIFGRIYPGLLHVVVMNLFVIALCVIFAIFLPKIGEIIRFSGAACGLVYIFTLPCLVYMKQQRQLGTLSWPSTIFHVFIIILGVANLVAQFVILKFS